MNPIHEDALINANDALGNQIQDIDSEEHIYSEIDVKQESLRCNYGSL
jgi:hypothetical protein